MSRNFNTSGVFPKMHKCNIRFFMLYRKKGGRRKEESENQISPKGLNRKPKTSKNAPFSRL